MLIRRCRGWAGVRHWLWGRVLGVMRSRDRWFGVTDGMCAECAALMRVEGLRERLAKLERLLDGRPAARVAASDTRRTP